MPSMQDHFSFFRSNIVGIHQHFRSPYGEKRILYADWTASGRLYAPIEKILSEEIGPFVANTHTETTLTGASMTLAYHKSLEIIKAHVHANAQDAIISCESGMTGVVNKLQRMLGLRLHEKWANSLDLRPEDKPIVFVTHMEHHSNQTSWLETIADVEVIYPDTAGLPDLAYLQKMLYVYRDRKVKIASITSCSNVTGVFTPYHQIAEIMHQNGGLCFVDFAASAPYISINMHPDNPLQSLDAIYFSMHKFLGGPGSTGILVFNKNLYQNQVPDKPGGGTVDWTNPWGEHKYIDDIEAREDGGTPAFLQTIKAALCIRLKEQMGVAAILRREEEMLDKIWKHLDLIPNLHVLANHIRSRLGIISFYIKDLHYNLAVRILNDRFGIQTRGGCSCAGTYGHYLFQVSKDYSHTMTDKITQKDYSSKLGWVRMSIHPTMLDAELDFLLDALTQLATHHALWTESYVYQPCSNEFIHKDSHGVELEKILVDKWLGKEMSPMSFPAPSTI